MIRVDFSDQERWEALRALVTTSSRDGFMANVHLVDDPTYGEVTIQQLAAQVRPYSLLVVADKQAVDSPEHPLLAIYRSGEGVEQLRVVATELWSIENNITLGNMDWKEFKHAADSDGVFRGF